MRREFQRERRVPAAVFLKSVVVQADLGRGHRSIKVYKDALSGPFLRRAELAAIERDDLEGLVIEGMPGELHIGMRQVDARPILGVGVNPLGGEEPVAIQIISPAMGVGFARRLRPESACHGGGSRSA